MRMNRNCGRKLIHQSAAAVLLLGAAYGAHAGNCPADVATLPAGTWCEVPNSHMRGVAFQWPAGVTFTQNGVGVDGVMSLWSGGAFDTKRNRLIVWGGGHFGYAGNEIYAFDVNTLSWTRVTDPSIPVGDNVPYAPDGGPTSRHTYNYVEYVPSIDRFCSFGGAGFYSDGQHGTNNTDCFNFDAKQWERKAAIPSTGTTTIGSKAAYDPVSGRVYLQTGLGGTFSSYDPGTNTWTTLVSSSFMDYYLTAAIDPVRRKMVAVGIGQLRVLDLNNPSAGWSDLSTSGDMTIVNAQAPGFVYDPVSDRFVGWSGGASVYTLNMDTRIWSKLPLAAGNSTTPTAAAGDGTYGRFRYIPSKNAFIVVNSIDEDVFFYKLSSAAGSPPPAQPAQPTVTVR
jgi:hypothetical protein